MFETFKRERAIRKALHAIARQRVVRVLQPGNVLLVEQTPPNEEWFDVAVRTSHSRGWVDVLYDSIPTGAVQFEGSTPVIPQGMTSKPIYRLTEGGWAVNSSITRLVDSHIHRRSAQFACRRGIRVGDAAVG